MNGHRIIIYNVSETEYEKAVKLATQVYKARYGAEPKNVTLPRTVPESLVLVGGSLSVDGLQLEIDKNCASIGTIQVGR